MGNAQHRRVVPLSSHDTRRKTPPMTGRLALPLLLLLTLTLPLPQAHARPLMQEDLPPETRWVAHLDVTALLESDLGRRLLAEADTDDIEQGRNFVRDSTGLGPLTDLHSITAFGPSPDPMEAVAVVRGDFDPDRLLGLVVGPEDEQSEHGKHTIYQWTQQTQAPKDDGTRYSAFTDSHTLLIARSRAAVERTLDVLDGKAEDASDSNRVLKVTDFAGDKGGKDGAFLIAAARDLQPPRVSGRQRNPWRGCCRRFAMRRCGWAM